MVLLCGCRKSYYIVAVILAFGDLTTEGFAPKQHAVASKRIPLVRNDQVLSTISRLFAVLPLPPAAAAVEAPFTTSTLVTAAVTTTAATAASSPATTTSNLPSQKELLSKASVATTTTTASTAASSSSSSTSSSSGSGLAISNIEYDGKVPKVESDEYVVLTNNNKNSMDISGYYIYVATTGTQGPTFVFPSGTVLKPNQSIRVYTNEIHKESGGYTFESGKAIWNNNGGIAVLKDSSNKKIMEYKYKAPK